MGKVLEKFGKWVGIDYEEEEITDEYEESPARDNAQRYLRTTPAVKQNIVALPQSKASKMVIFRPTSFDEVQTMAGNLKNRSSVIVNLSEADGHIGKRIFDFLSGTVYALGGDVKKIGDDIIIFTPDNVDVSERDAVMGDYGERHKLPWEK